MSQHTPGPYARYNPKAYDLAALLLSGYAASLSDIDALAIVIQRAADIHITFANLRELEGA